MCDSKWSPSSRAELAPGGQGGGVAGGQVYGKTDKGIEVTENKVSVPDFNATLAYALGLPLEQIVHSPTMRPFTVANKGKPATSLFA